MLKVSWLHRFLRIEPGRAPWWVCSRDSCAGIDVLSFVGSLISLLAMLLCRAHALVAAALAILTVMFAIYAMIPFETCERRARARRRRNECIFCGRALESQSPESFQGCQCRAEGPK